MQILEEELLELKATISKMWELVIKQLKKTHESLITFDKDLAREVTVLEKRVNGLELKIDSDCENIIGCLPPAVSSGGSHCSADAPGLVS